VSKSLEIVKNIVSNGYTAVAIQGGDA